MLLVFVGQVTAASALPCQMDMQKQSTMMDHSSHMMADQVDENSKSSMSDCCAKNGNCSMSGCISLVIPGLSLEFSMNFSSESVERPMQLPISKIPSSLYRPPIQG